MDSDYVHVTKAAPNIRPVQSDGSEEDEQVSEEQDDTTPRKCDKRAENIAKHQTEELTVEKEKEAIENVTSLIPVRQNCDEFLSNL